MAQKYGRTDQLTSILSSGFLAFYSLNIFQASYFLCECLIYIITLIYIYNNKSITKQWSNEIMK